MKWRFELLARRLLAPVDVAPLVLVRIVYGLTMLWWVHRQFDLELIRKYYVDPGFFFKFYGFAWVETLPERSMEVLVFSLGILAVFITVGFLYRISIVLFTLGRTYIFLIDASLFINHEYLARTGSGGDTRVLRPSPLDQRISPRTNLCTTHSGTLLHSF